MSIRWHDTATIVRAGTTSDPYGGSATEADWTNVTETSGVSCSIQPASSLEQNLDRETVVGQWSGYFPAGTDLLPTDRISWRDRTLTVDGDVAPWVKGGAVHHLEVPLKEIA